MLGISVLWVCHCSVRYCIQSFTDLLTPLFSWKVINKSRATLRRQGSRRNEVEWSASRRRNSTLGRDYHFYLIRVHDWALWYQLHSVNLFVIIRWLPTAISVVLLTVKFMFWIPLYAYSIVRNASVAWFIPLESKTGWHRHLVPSEVWERFASLGTIHTEKTLEHASHGAIESFYEYLCHRVRHA